MTKYNSKDDTNKHRLGVGFLLSDVATELLKRADNHDLSKLQSPEKEMFDIWRPKLDSLPIDSDAYKEALRQMGSALQHHYEHNSHHPENHVGGISGMNLIDLIEMVCDWMAAAKRKDPNGKVDLVWAKERFGIDEQLLSIISNTIGELATK